ncbi:hypothetical protein [Caldifermentibacillus hisashii]|uniref:hypothetical protein n=1 Tax=Caldifermentibacillus hisashii TaxID=996558 RepID=UPI001C122A87|nr:hypothetical protein [Caldifermentibacillus hisashii]MBU5342740.1 hypothetical protein [Caldifermentibacillus hisashii]
MMTKPNLVAILGREILNFGDEPQSRHHFGAENAQFWRRASFSSPFLVGKLHFLATRPVLVTVFGRETSFFGDEASSRHRFEAGNAQFLTTKRILVAILR